MGCQNCILKGLIAFSDHPCNKVKSAVRLLPSLSTFELRANFADYVTINVPAFVANLLQIRSTEFTSGDGHPAITSAGRTAEALQAAPIRPRHLVASRSFMSHPTPSTAGCPGVPLTHARGQYAFQPRNLLATQLREVFRYLPRGCSTCWISVWSLKACFWPKPQPRRS